ncbi:hypothetical protein HMPREF0291_11764 [Corynebacterium genitalium ATCC 33030]|uniref:Alpha/beta hydrolase n=1 Tax=Corynebacterium genitalium ATCC 33030 TaxID=585529 RepID=D7WD76_9CORY|nr:hypothetical protein HMPREF0291_11764 [Corynebacterium genitalium ATCC 33030]
MLLKWHVCPAGCSKPTQRVKVQGSGHNWWYDPSAANDMWAVLSRVHK